jgi:hypothetical protein
MRGLIGGKAASHPFAQRGVERRLVWILGSPRSGSTWLLQMLAECDGITCVDEPLVGLHLAPFVCDRPGTFASDLDETNFSFNRIAKNNHSYFFSEEHRAAWLGPLRKLITSRFAVHGTRDLIAIKEPNGSQAADLILQAVPKSRLLFLLRDGRDVVDSELAAHSPGAWMTRRYPIRGVDASQRGEFLEDAAHKWVWQTHVVEEAFENHDGPKLLVRYEELRSATGPQLERILSWLGLSIDVRAIVSRYTFESQAARGPAEFVRSAEPGAWRSNLEHSEQSRIEQIMGPTLRRFGY